MTDTAVKANKGAVHLTDAEFEKTINEAGVPVFIDFYATWCGPCRQAAPIVDRLAGEFDGKILISKLDVDENPQVTQKFEIRSIPTVIVLKKVGDQITEVDRKVGFPGEEGYRQMLAKALGTEQA